MFEKLFACAIKMALISGETSEVSKTSEVCHTESEVDSGEYRHITLVKIA
jgi:hypothetical protein